MNYRQKQKSLLIDPSNLLTFNVSHEHIHMKKIKNSSISNSRNQSSDDLQSIPDSSMTVNTKIYYSVVEKQSESGISFNDRLFFLKDEDILGYMSKPDKNFDVKNAKETIPIKCLRRVTPKGKTLMLEFDVKSAKDNKMVQKKWLLRMRDKKMADAWTDIINYQVGQIPSRKSTMQRQDSRMTPLSTERKQEMQTADKTTNYFSKMQQPIANQRPEQDYVSEVKKSSSVSAKTPRSLMAAESKQISESPVRDEYSNSSNQKGEMSPQLSAQRTYERERSSGFNSTSERHSQKKQRYMSSGIKFYQTGEFTLDNNYFEEIQLAFKQKNQEMRQKLILPSFYNYFRPYIDQLTTKRSSVRLQVDKKYEDFITFCQLTAKQLIDKNDTPLSDFKLSNRFIPHKNSSPKDKLLKEMGQMYEEVFGKPMPQTMELEALFLLFENILYLSLEDTDLIIPLAELKTLPSAADSQNDPNASLTKICQNSLITEFQAKEKNLQYIYSQISKIDVLRDNFLVPMSCQVEYKGFTMFFRPKINQTLFKTTSAAFYDSSLQIGYIANSNAKNQAGQVILDQIYEKLASSLYINSQVLEREIHFKINPIRAKQNLGDKLANNNYKEFKYVIIFADILPCLESKQIVEPKIFMKVHQSDTIPNIQLLKSDFAEQTSRKINPLNQEETSSFVPSVLKSQSIYKKKQTQKLPLYNQLGTGKQNDLQLRLYKQEIKERVKDVSKKLDRFDVSIIHPSELNQLLKITSLNHSSLGKIYQQISGKNSFVKSLIKSQIAAECTKLVLFKKCQQLIMSPKQDKPKQRDEISMKNVTTLLNLILGKSSTKQTQMIWKVLTLHSQLLYSVSISQQQIHKGYFILALSSKLNILINPNSVSIVDIFNHDKFVSAIRFQSCKIRPVQVVSALLNEIQETQPNELINNANTYFKRLQQAISIASSPIPYFIKRSKQIYNKILLILTQKISPNNLNFNHLNVYQTKQLNFTQTPGSFPLIQQTRQTETATSLIKQKQLSLKRQFWEDNFSMYFRRKLKELQYKAVERNSFNLQQQSQNLMKEVKVFYEYHPLMSEFLEFLSDFHLSKGQYQRAIDCLKASLSNIISVCEGNSNHVKLANSFLKTAMVYEKMGRLDDALNQLKRTKHCLEINQQDNTPFSANLLLKIAKIAIKMDGKLHQSLNYLFAAQKILQTSPNLYDNVELIIDAYETQSKCLYSPQFDFNALKSSQILDRATRSQHYFVTLEKILIHENEMIKKKPNNSVQLIDSQKLIKILKLVLPFYFQTISEKGGEMLMIYMCELSQNIAKKGGIDLAIPQIVSLDKTQTERLQTNQQPEFFFYPTQTNRSKPQQQQNPDSKATKPTKKQYNFHQAFHYLKKQICDGSFIMQIMQFMQKVQEILTIIKRQIKQNVLNKSHSRSSSRVYFMSTKGADDWDAVVNGEIASEPNRRSGKGTPELRDEEDIDLEKLLDYSKELRSSSHDAGYSQRERKFDSVMKALMVLLGDGFMLHIFEE